MDLLLIDACWDRNTLLTDTGQLEKMFETGHISEREGIITFC